MNISIASYAFHGLLAEGKMDVFGYLESVKYRYHLDAADIWNGMLPNAEEEYIRKVREAMDEKEMGLANLCVDDAHLWDADSDERERLHRNALAHLRAAVILGALTVRIDMGIREETMSDEQLDFIAGRYREYARFAADHGFRVGTENHWGASRWWKHQERVIRAVDHPAYGVLLHIGNWAENPDESDRNAAPYAMHTHVAAGVVEDCLEEKIDMLLAAGYQGYWGVEHHTGKHEYAEVAWQLAEVRRVLERKRA